MKEKRFDFVIPTVFSFKYAAAVSYYGSLAFHSEDELS